MESLKESHWKARKRILRNVSGTKDFCILYSISKYFKPVGYTDSDCGVSMNDRKITLGYTFHFHTSVVSRDSKKHPIVTLSSSEAEYVVDKSCI